MRHKIGISIIGAGRVGWHLGQALSAAGFSIHEVWSLRQSQARLLADKLPEAAVSPSLDFSQSKAQLFLLTITDTAVEGIARQLQLPKGSLLAHTSGSLPLSALQGAAATYTGVFYPLQTFSKEKEVNFSHIPFCIEGSDSAALLLLEAVASSLSHKVVRMDGEQRRQLHLAAVFACNFSNHLLRIAHELLEAGNLPPDLLHPLIEETLQKALRLGPAQAQTGPAIRGDATVIEQHQKLLFRQPEWAQLYKLLSDDIRKKYLPNE